jgi:glycine hydroxymethyltransferase
LTSRNFKEDDFIQVVEFLDRGVQIALEAQDKTGETIINPTPFTQEHIAQQKNCSREKCLLNVKNIT